MTTLSLTHNAWRALWPVEVVEDFQSPVPDVAWKGQIARHRRVLQAAMGVSGAHCGLLEVSDLLRRMDEWTHRHSAFLTVPPSMEGWSRAVWATLSEPHGKEDMAWLWAGFGSSVQRALAARPAQPSWAVAFISSASPLVEKITPTPAASAPAPAEPSPPAEPTPASAKPASRHAPPPSPEVVALRGWLSDALRELSRSNEPTGILVEKFDQKLKEKIASSAQPGPNHRAGWVEYALLPAIVGMDVRQMETLATLWPHQQSVSFIDPKKTLSGKRFWGLVEGVADAKAKDVLFTRVLPTIINPGSWSSSLRHGLALSMLEWTKGKPEAFEERLMLWRAWGGKMDDAAAPAAPTQGVFRSAAPPTETVEQWIASQNNKAWDAIVEKTATPVRSSRSAPSP